MKIECQLDDIFQVMQKKLSQEGLLLTSGGKNQRLNVMTIGWGLVGRLWREPVYMVAVRPSRYTYEFIEATKEFSVNIPAEGMEDTLAYCGQVSGRDSDKFGERRLTALPGKQVKAPIIKECIGHIECQVIGTSTVHPERISSSVQQSCYSAGDYHTLYYGRILTILKEK
jgi:flavin reductase (DIM6/NTAB) family NADH-FMN oxidoreductase RutF